MVAQTFNPLVYAVDAVERGQRVVVYHDCDRLRNCGAHTYTRRTSDAGRSEDPLRGSLPSIVSGAEDERYLVDWYGNSLCVCRL